MAESSQDEFSQFPVESIARFLSVCAGEDPTLVRRSRVPPAVAALDRINMRLPPPLRSSGPPPPPAGDTCDESAYLEELVSIAVASARQAEDAARQVRAAGAAARRRMFAISAFGAIGIVTGIAGIVGARFGPDISGLSVIGSGKLAMANNDQPTEQRGVVASHSPPEAAMQPPRPPPSDGSPRDLAALPRTAEPPLASVAARAPATSEKGPPAPPQPAGPQTVEATLHDNAAREAAELRATASPFQYDAATDNAPTPMVASVAPDEANNRAGPLFVRPLPVPPNSSRIMRSQVTAVPVEPRRGASSAPAAVRVTAATPSKPWQLVAAVQALEALTNSAGEPGAPP